LASTALAAASLAVGTSILRCEITSEAWAYDPGIAQCCLDRLGHRIGAASVEVLRQSCVVDADGGNGGHDKSFQEDGLAAAPVL